MRIPAFLCAVLFCVFAPPCPLIAQAPSTRSTQVTVTGGINTPTRSTTFPMQLRGNHIYVEATMNGKPVRLIVDNGAALNVLSPEAAKRLGITSSFKASAEGATTVQGSGTVVDTITVGAAELKNVPTFIVTLPDEADCDGFLGAPLFGLFTVTLDYENKQVTLAEPNPKFAIPGALSLPLKVQDNLALVDATVAGIKGRFQTDTGSKGSLILFGPFVDKHHLRDKFTPRIRTITGQGVGGFTYGDITRIPSLTLGDRRNNVTFDKLDGELSDQTQGGFYSKTLAGNLGGEILSRFTVTFDYAHEHLFLQKNAKFTDPFIGNRSGLSLTYVRQEGAGGVFKVLSVIPGSPADKADITTGDTIVSVDNQATGQRTPQETRALFRQPVGTAVSLEVVSAKGGAPRKVSLILRDLI